MTESRLVEILFKEVYQIIRIQGLVTFLGPFLSKSLGLFLHLLYFTFGLRSHRHDGK